jgi:hypothetical protein
MELISFRLARAQLGVHGATLRRWIAEGVLEATPLPDGRLGFDAAELERRRATLWSPPPAAGATCPSDAVEGIWSVPPALRKEAPPPDQERRSTHAPTRYPGTPRPGEAPPAEPERRR